MEQRRLLKSGDKKADFIPNLTGIPIQRRLAPKTQDQTAFDNVRVQYSLNDANSQSQPAVIQRKQIVPLAERLKRFNADAIMKNFEFKALLEQYDRLDNTFATRDAQKAYLEFMLMKARKMGEEARRAESILEDELSFVTHQSYDRPLDPPPDPWAYMNDSPFIKMLQLLAEEEKLPLPGKHLTARQLIGFMSELHYERLVTGQQSETDYMTIAALQRRVLDCIRNEGVLAHYSHREKLFLIHSTDYLKANNLLASNATANTNVSAKDMTTKSEPVDIERVRNSGFVFMFLERRNADHRKTRFGNIRYSVPLSSSYGRNLLEQGWVILHDWGSLPQPSSKHGLIYTVQRDITPSNDPSAMLEKLSQKIPEPKTKEDPSFSTLLGMLSCLIGTGWYDTGFSQDEGEPSPVLQSGVSDHYLMGADILPGIALRVARELYILFQYKKEDYEKVIQNDDNLWQYISKVVYDMQIMLPESVMPETYD